MLGGETRCTVDTFQTRKKAPANDRRAWIKKREQSRVCRTCLFMEHVGDVGDDIEVIVMFSWFLFVAGVFWSTCVLRYLQSV